MSNNWMAYPFSFTCNQISALSLVLLFILKRVDSRTMENMPVLQPEVKWGQCCQGLCWDPAGGTVTLLKNLVKLMRFFFHPASTNFPSFGLSQASLIWLKAKSSHQYFFGGWWCFNDLESWFLHQVWMIKKGLAHMPSLSSLFCCHHQRQNSVLDGPLV